MSYYNQLLNSVISNSWTLTEVIVFLLSLISIPIFLYWRNWRKIMRKLSWIVPLSVFGVLVLINLIVVPHTIYSQQQQTITELTNELEVAQGQQFALPDELLASHLSGMQIRLTDLTRENPYIRNKVFTECDLYGPCVVQFVDSNVVNAQIEKDSVDAILISTTNERLYGVIQFKNCVLDSCRFWHIGIIGSPEYIEKLKSEVIYED